MRRLLPALVLLALPLLEIALLIRTGQKIGLWPTLGIVVGTGALGIYVLVNQQFAVVQRVMEAMNAGKTPLGPVLDGAFTVLAGGLLFSPGLICDAAGLLLLVPPVRHRIARWWTQRLLRDGDIEVAVHTGRGGAPQAGGGVPPAGGGTVIDGEFERLGERKALPDRGGDKP